MHNTEGLRRETRRTLAELSNDLLAGAGTGRGREPCGDILDKFKGQGGSIKVMAWSTRTVPGFGDSFAQADESCPGGCPDRFKPMCRKGTCLAPSCTFYAEACHEEGIQGIRARHFCGATCGCGTYNSFVKQNGCPPACTMSANRVLAAAPCTDAPPNSSSLMDYLNALVPTISRRGVVFKKQCNNEACPFRDAMHKHGCQALLIKGINDSLPARFFCQKEAPASFRSGARLCPVACQCRSGEPGCPPSCPASQLGWTSRMSAQHECRCNMMPVHGGGKQMLP